MSDCGVCIGGDWDSDGMPEFYTVKTVKARKQHKCLECQRPIAAGSPYERQSGKFDGDIFCDKICMDCVNIREGLSCGEPVLTGTLWEEIDNVFPQLTTVCIAKVETASAKAYLVQRWQEWKGLTA